MTVTTTTLVDVPTGLTFTFWKAGRFIQVWINSSTNGSGTINGDEIVGRTSNGTAVKIPSGYEPCTDKRELFINDIIYGTNFGNYAGFYIQKNNDGYYIHVGSQKVECPSWHLGHLGYIGQS